jgi:hypothetical protein
MTEEGTKVCRKCGLEKPVGEFSSAGHGLVCRSCVSKYNKDYAKKRRENSGAPLGPVFVDDAPDGMKTCRRCGKVYPNTIEFFHIDRRYGSTHAYCKPCWNELARNWHRELRLEVLKHYSGSPPKCSCCGEPRIEFLAMDHENDDGGEHRREIKAAGSRTIYSWLKKHGYPTGFRVLCHNCNLARGFYGYCPHEKERELRNLVHIVKDETGKEKV